MEFVERAGALGLAIRCGLHTGESEVVGGEIGGLAAQIASRVLTRAAAGEVVASGTITDLVAGSGIAFEAIDNRLVAGTGHSIALYRVTDAFGNPAAPAIEPVRAPHDQSPLTRREREVAILVGRGLSNRMIGDELSISVATVERHIANIFTKLDVHSRTQVATWVSGRGYLRSHVT
jgi:DNA-binding NarL/FixJ family response regulator